jgi:hypothetical protein
MTMRFDAHSVACHTGKVQQFLQIRLSLPQVWSLL